MATGKPNFNEAQLHIVIVVFHLPFSAKNCHCKKQTNKTTGNHRTRNGKATNAHIRLTFLRGIGGITKPAHLSLIADYTAMISAC